MLPRAGSHAGSKAVALILSDLVQLYFLTTGGITTRLELLPYLEY